MIEIEQLNKLKSYSNGIKILCVDDDSLLREFLFTLLSNHFEHIDMANNGEEGLFLYKKINHDIVLTDIKMPVMNGIEMVKQIKKLNPQQQILVFSAYQNATDLVELINYSVSHFLNKPFSIVNLINKITDICEQIYNRSELVKYQTKLEKMVEEKTTKIKKQKIQLQKKNDFLQEVIDALSLPFMIGEIFNKQIVYANRAAKELDIPSGSSRFSHFFPKEIVDEIQNHECSVTKERAYNNTKSLNLYTAYYFPVIEANGDVKQIIQYLIKINDENQAVIDPEIHEKRLRFELKNTQVIADLAKAANLSDNFDLDIGHLIFMVANFYKISAVAFYDINEENLSLIYRNSYSHDNSLIKLPKEVKYDSLSPVFIENIVAGTKLVCNSLSELSLQDRELFQTLNISAFIIMPVRREEKIIGLTVLAQSEELTWNYKHLNWFASINGIITNLLNRTKGS